MKKFTMISYFLAVMIFVGMSLIPVDSQEATSKEPSVAQEQRTAKILQIAQLGNPVLREQARPIENLSSLLIKELIADFKVTVFDANGLGLAAPQEIGRASCRERV